MTLVGEKLIELYHSIEGMTSASAQQEFSRSPRLFASRDGHPLNRHPTKDVGATLEAVRDRTAAELQVQAKVCVHAESNQRADSSITGAVGATGSARPLRNGPSAWIEFQNSHKWSAHTSCVRMSKKGREWPNTNRSLGSRPSTDTDGQEVTRTDLTRMAAFPAAGQGRVAITSSGRRSSRVEH